MAQYPALITLATLTGSTGVNPGFVLTGIDENDRCGWSVASAGDINGDGFADVIVGAASADPGLINYAGESYVVFGKAAGFAATFDLSTLDGINGFRLDGIGDGDRSGTSVASAGDLNGDGFADIVIGAYHANPGGDGDAGESYVVFGKADWSATPAVELGALDGTNGFRIDGITAGDLSGRSVSGAGDVNGDGFADLIIGADSANPGGDGDAGESYVVFGTDAGFAASLDLATLDGSNGFRLDGIDPGDRTGRSVSAAGDVNGDGFADLIIGADQADPGGDAAAGETYVVFGKGTFGASIDLAGLNGANGFRLDGIDISDTSGFAVSGAGDVNGDGFADVIIGASRGAPLGRTDAGESYVVFGKATGFAASLDLSTLDGSNGFRLDGTNANNRSGLAVSGAGDVNGDGFADVLIGSYRADPPGATDAGSSFIVFGKGFGFAASLDLATLDGTNGFRLNGIDISDISGFAVGSAGDVNGDGLSDLIISGREAEQGILSNVGEAYVVLAHMPDAAVTRIGSAGGQTIVGGDFDDLLSGLGGDDILLGNAGKDTLIGGTGGDTMRGGVGDDYYVVDDLDDLVIENVGEGITDTVQSSISLTLAVNVERGILSGTGSRDLTGNTLANRLTGNSGNNELFGLDGDDRMLGAGGKDVLTGGKGKDTLSGGFAADTYDYNLATETGKTAATRDVITDFQHLTDDIDLSTIDAKKGAGNQAFKFIGAAGFHKKAGELHFKLEDLAGTVNDKTLIEGDTNGDGKADFQIELSGLKTLTVDDFIL